MENKRYPEHFVIRYYLNGYAMIKLEGHKANKNGAEVLAPFCRMKSLTACIQL